VSERLKCHGCHVVLTGIGLTICTNCQITHLKSRIEKLRSCVEISAKQKLWDEMTGEEIEHGDFDGAYDIFIKQGRATLAADDAATAPISEWQKCRNEIIEEQGGGE